MTLYNSYRPRTWDEFIEDQAFKESLQRMADDAHPMLFIGPAGCGKTTAARLIAADVLGAEFREGVTYLEINCADHTGVDDMRALLQLASARPIGAHNRLIVLDECHQLSKSAWNLLLKPLEDGSEHTRWILCTSEPKGVIKAAASRCVHFGFEKATMRQLEQLLLLKNLL